jgi:arylsulfatase A-like enzyme
VFRPKVLGITLQNHDVAHNSFNGYVDVIRRNDAELGKLWDAIQADQELAETTAVVVLPEFGRDKDLNERNGLDHGDRSDHMRKVFLIAAGPDFKRNRVVKTDVRSIDVCPTLLSLFSKQPPAWSRARIMRDLFA